jgi:hypothetical protein
MKTWKYWKHPNKHNTREVVLIFSCEAHSIMEADRLFEAATGIKPEKAFDVGCTSHEPEQET